jgi:hypothetical protein
MSRDLIYFHLLNDTFKFGKATQIEKLHKTFQTHLYKEDYYLNIATCCYNKKTITAKNDGALFIDDKRFPICYRRGNIGLDEEKPLVLNILNKYMYWLRIYDRNKDIEEIEDLINLEFEKEKFSTYGFKKLAADFNNESFDDYSYDNNVKGRDNPSYKKDFEEISRDSDYVKDSFINDSKSDSTSSFDDEFLNDEKSFDYKEFKEKYRKNKSSINLMERNLNLFDNRNLNRTHRKEEKNRFIGVKKIKPKTKINDARDKYFRIKKKKEMDCIIKNFKPKTFGNKDPHFEQVGNNNYAVKINNHIVGMVKKKTNNNTCNNNYNKNYNNNNYNNYNSFFQKNSITNYHNNNNHIFNHNNDKNNIINLNDESDVDEIKDIASNINSKLNDRSDIEILIFDESISNGDNNLNISNKNNFLNKKNINLNLNLDFPFGIEKCNYKNMMSRQIKDFLDLKNISRKKTTKKEREKFFEL